VTSAPTLLPPEAAGVTLTAREFDAAEGEGGWRYELIRGVVVVSPAPSAEERGPNERLGYQLLFYQENHPEGPYLDDTLPEHDIHIGDDRRRADRVIWAGQGRQPGLDQTPTIAAEFVSAGKQNFLRDYEIKRDEYASIGIREYWIFNRFQRTMTVCKPDEAPRVLNESDVYSTPLLPGFELKPADLFAAADRWSQS